MSPSGPDHDGARLHSLADAELVDDQARRLVLRAGIGGRRADLRLCEAANRILRGLDHRTIATAHKVERDDRERLVLAYDLDGHKPLSARLEEDGPALAVHVLIELCDALDAAHSLGVIHGALTPDSVRLGEDAARPAVRVADFGLGHLFGPESVLEERVRWLPYSPEKQLGLEPSPAEDVYLLGTLGYAMITGRPLFDGATRQQTLRQHAIESATDVMEGRLNCAPWLSDVLTRCLHKEADERFSTPAAVADALRTGQAEAEEDAPEPEDAVDAPRSVELRVLPPSPDPRPATPTHAQERPGSPTSSKRTATMFVAAAAAVACIAWAASPGGFGLLPSSTAPPPAAPSGAARRTSAPPRPDSPTRAPASDTAPGSGEAPPDDAPPAPAAEEPTSDDALAMADPPQEPGEPAASQTPSEPAETPVEPSDASPEVDEAQAEADEAQAEADEAQAVRLTRNARAALRSGNGAKAVRLYERALAVREGHAVAAHELGALHFDRGNYRAAIRRAKQATGAAPRNGTYRLALGDYYSKSGNDAAARRHWKRAANLGNADAKTRSSG